MGWHCRRLKKDEFCIRNDEIFIKKWITQLAWERKRSAEEKARKQVNNDEFCITNDELCITNDGFCINNAQFYI